MKRKDDRIRKLSLYWSKAIDTFPLFASVLFIDEAAQQKLNLIDMSPLLFEEIIGLYYRY